MRVERLQRARHFYTTPVQPCPYLTGKLERKLFTELSGHTSETLYNDLSRAGFRRSHQIAYAPVCQDCSACKAARIVVNDFVPTRSQKRVLRNNRALTLEAKPAVATEEQFDLFARYVIERHGDGEMANMGRIDFRYLVEETSVNSGVFEFRNASGRLYAACITDYLDDGLSAVYSFFEPHAEKDGLGNFIILSLIAQARKLNVPYIYLGFWINGSPKMSYKERFQPLEIYDAGQWISNRNNSRCTS